MTFVYHRTLRQKTSSRLTNLLLSTDMCYTPASYAKQEDLALKAQLFKDRKGTVSGNPLTAAFLYQIQP